MYRLNNGMAMEKTEDGEMIVYDENNGMMHILNRTAADIIGFIMDDAAITADEIQQRIKMLYRTDKTNDRELMQDIEQLLETLRNNGILAFEEGKE